MSNDSVLIEILNGTQPSSCGCSSCGGECSSEGCGPTTTNYEDDVQRLTQELKSIYGDSVSVKYVNVDKDGIEDYPIMNRVLSMGYPYPITLINGDPKFAGAIMIDEVKSSIAEMKKSEAN